VSRTRAVVLLAFLSGVALPGPLAPSASASPSAALEGRLVTVSVDHEDGASEESWLQHGGRHLRVRGAAAGPGGREPVSGARVRIRGELAGTTVQAESVEVLAPAPAVEPAGRRRVLVMLVQWTAPDAVTPASAAAQVGPTADAWFTEASLGRMGTQATVTPWLAIPASSCADYYGILARAREAARARGLDPAAYDHEMVYFPRDERCPSWAGMAEVGGRVSWINGVLDTRVTVHELGHNLGLRHAGSLACRDTGGTPVVLDPRAGACTHEEYGDAFDAMGGSGHAAHFSASAKHGLGWLDGRIETVTADASLTLAPVAAPAGLQGAVIPATARSYWLEFRRPQGLDAFMTAYPGITDGVLIRAQAPSAGTQLLDLRPGLPGAFGDAALPVGRTWTTPEGIAIRVDAAGPAEARVSVRMPVPATAGEVGNLVANPSFESSAGDWGAWQGTVAREALAGAPHGAHVARVARTAGTSYALNDVAGGLPPTVTSTVAGGRYAAAAWVQAGSPGAVGRPVRLVLRETTPTGALVREASTPAILGGAFARLAVEAVAGAAGNRLDVRISQGSAVAGDAFLADDISVTRVRDTAPPPPPPLPPPAPGNLIGDGGFEAGLTGWTGWQSAIARVPLAGAPAGTHVARATRTAGTSYTLNHGGLPPATVPVTVAGAGYRAAVMVRAASAASAGRPVTLTIRERTIAGATVRQWSGAGTLPAASFARLTATASVVATGNMLDVRVSQGAAVAGDAFYADAFSLERTG
jgi:hypothetical protein